MDVRLKFPILRPLKLDDAWPINGSGVEMSFEITDGAATALVLLFRNQPTEMAPSIDKLSGPIKAQINIKGGIESIGRRIAQRFSDYINLYFVVPFDLKAMEAEYIPSDDAERAAMQMFSFKSKMEQQNPPLPFDLMAQAFYAVESDEDPSFVSHMTQLTREALIAGQDIDAFRYGFLLIEALYGNGKFQTRDLVRELLDSADFRPMIERTIAAIQHDPVHRDSVAKATIAKHGTAEAPIKHLVDRRGFYFHGNLKRKDAWRPDKASEARPIAEIVVDLAGQIAASYGSAMFGANVNTRYMSNARSQGAMMTIQVQFHFVDNNGIRRTGSIEFDAPGTRATSNLAIKVNGHFLQWAETELRGETLVSARGVVKETGVEVFRTQFLKPADASPAD